MTDHPRQMRDPDWKPPAVPPELPPGQWWTSVEKTTANGRDTYAGIHGDGNGFSITVPEGAPSPLGPAHV